MTGRIRGSRKTRRKVLFIGGFGAEGLEGLEAMEAER